jgi:hypothetical protein
MPAHANGLWYFAIVGVFTIYTMVPVLKAKKEFPHYTYIEYNIFFNQKTTKTLQSKFDRQHCVNLKLG